jgi:hypothetical protein
VKFETLPTTDVRSGSNATEIGCPSYVRFPPESDRTADIAERLKPAQDRTCGPGAPPHRDLLMAAS